MKTFLLLLKFDEFNVPEFIASVLVTIIFTTIVYYLKPKLKIICACWDNEQRKIKIKVENHGRFDAVNLRMEVCAYNETSKQTIHLKLEQYEFLILPRKNSVDNLKTFKVIDVEDFAQEYGTYSDAINLIRNNHWKLRVRLHSYHSFSGFGKTEEVFLTL